MLGSSVSLGNSGGATVNLRNEEGGCAGSGFAKEDDDRNSASNRWPREETLALLKIRSGMDVAFRDSILKAPLWDEVSRKLGELGYHRSAKKCKEKFENIYKYHKRTKEGRSGRQNGKNYQFFQQLEVFENQPPSLPSPQTCVTDTPMAIPALATKTMTAIIKPTTISQDFAETPCLNHNPITQFMSNSASTTASSGKESRANARKKRKLANYLERLMKEVLEKQENLQNKFIEAIEKCENDRIAREEARKMEELARARKEQEIMAQERAIAAAKDAAVIAFLQKMSEQAIPQVRLSENPSEKGMEKQENSYGENITCIRGSSSRWPKVEVEALIRLRNSNTELQYVDNGGKGPLWEEISSGMKKLGYDRSAKRCKEKWENINKYYKRVKERNRKRAEDSKTCPYFHLLESIYEGRKSKKQVESSINSDATGNCNLKPEDILMQMLGQREQTQHSEGDNIDQNQEEDEEDNEEEEEDNGDDYQIVANNTSSVAAME